MKNQGSPTDAWLFPGQGSQGPGMFDRLAASKQLIERIEQKIGPSAGSLTQLGHTTWTTQLVQPAVYAASLAAARAISDSRLPAAVIGHSLGEISALVAAGALSIDAGLELVIERGTAMQMAAKKHRGGMAAVIGLDASVIAEVCEKVGSVWVANHNSLDQTVISGLESSLAKAAESCLEAGARAVKRIAVPVAAHTPLMEPAAERMEAVLVGLEMSSPRCTFFSIVDGRRHEDPAEIRKLLVRGLTSPVLFHQTIEAAIASGLTSFVEVGPGGTLSRIVRRSFPETSVRSVSTDDEAAEYAGQLTVSPQERAGASAPAGASI